jgi:hypothetical protein
MLFQTNIAELKIIPTPRSRATSWHPGPKKGVSWGCKQENIKPGNDDWIPRATTYGFV